MGKRLPFHENKSHDEDIDDSDSEKFEINTGEKTGSTTKIGFFSSKVPGRVKIQNYIGNRVHKFPN